MDALRRLTSILLVFFCALCVAAWAAWVNPDAFGALPNPVGVEHFPGENKMMSALGFGFGSLAVAYFVYPSRKDDDD